MKRKVINSNLKQMKPLKQVTISLAEKRSMSEFLNYSLLRYTVTFTLASLFLGFNAGIHAYFYLVKSVTKLSHTSM